MKSGGYIQRKTRLQSKTGFKRRVSSVAGSVSPYNRSGSTKLPKLSTLRNKADNLLTPLIKRLYPTCLLRGSKNCAYETQVAHHHVHKSKSSLLRYDLQNLIPLCGACHVMLHNDESYWGAMVAKIKGPEWFAYIESKKHLGVKVDRFFYLEAIDRLNSL